jgi:hypothetical protein
MIQNFKQSQALMPKHWLLKKKNSGANEKGLAPSFYIHNPSTNDI